MPHHVHDDSRTRLTTFVAGRAVDDNVHVLVRYPGGARGMLWASQVAPGNENALKLRVYGDKAGLSWHQEHPNHLQIADLGEPPRTISRAGPGAGPSAGHATCVPAGHPEGYLEGFANLYTDLAEVITARIEGREPRPEASTVPTVVDGALGVRFITAAIESSGSGGSWVGADLDL